MAQKDNRQLVELLSTWFFRRDDMIIIRTMTTAVRDSITSPEEGMLIYNTTTSTLNVYSGGSWNAV
jgi:hypothetical protein